MLEELLSALRRPQDLEATQASLTQLAEALNLPAELPEDGGGEPIERQLLAVLVTRMRFYVLVLGAQHFLIRDLRGET